MSDSSRRRGRSRVFALALSSVRAGGEGKKNTHTINFTVAPWPAAALSAVADAVRVSFVTNDACGYRSVVSYIVVRFDLFILLLRSRAVTMHVGKCSRRLRRSSLCTCSPTYIFHTCISRWTRYLFLLARVQRRCVTPLSLSPPPPLYRDIALRI